VTVNYKYVNETAEIASYYSLDSGRDASLWSFAQNRSVSPVTDQRAATESSTPSEAARLNSPDNSLPSPPKRQRRDDLASYQPYHLQPSPGEAQSSHSSSASLSNRSHESVVSRNFRCRPTSDGPLSPQPHFDEQEACLMRYFIVQLAHCVSLRDLGWPFSPQLYLERKVDIFYRSIYVTVRDTSLRSFHCGQGRVLLYETRFTLHRQDT
jgi:hypothetical protein